MSSLKCTSLYAENSFRLNYWELVAAFRQTGARVWLNSISPIFSVKMFIIHFPTILQVCSDFYCAALFFQALIICSFVNL